MTAPSTRCGGKTCARCSCKLKSTNKSGYCQRCGVIVRSARLFCKACGCPISDKSKGHCKTCSNKLRRGPRPRVCLCGAELSRGALQGKCRKCFLEDVKAVPPPPVSRIWCRQCERNVRVAEASQCGSQWCRAKEAA